MNYELLKKKLKQNFNKKHDFDVALIKIGMFDPELIEAMDKYLETETLPDFSIDNISLYDIVDKIGCNEMQAFFNMDELIRDPEYKKCFKNISFKNK